MVNHDFARLTVCLVAVVLDHNRGRWTVMLMLHNDRTMVVVRTMDSDFKRLRTRGACKGKGASKNKRAGNESGLHDSPS